MHSKSAFAAAGLTLAGSLFAAGAALAASPSSWSGFYVGVQGGYSNLSDSEDYDPRSGDLLQNPYEVFGGSGASLGVFGGYNYQINKMFVLGVDGEVNLDSAVVHYADSEFGGPLAKENWSAAIRAKLGLVISPKVMVFATAGYAAAGFEAPGIWNYGGYETPGWTGTGAQFGLGASTQISDNLVANAEITYSSYGAQTVRYLGAPYFDLTESVLSAKAGLAWKFPAAGEQSAPDATATEQPVNWTGAYIGGQGGYTNYNEDEDYHPGFRTPLNPYEGFTSTGLGAGVFGGYNYQLNNMFVLGVDGEVNFENATLEFLNSTYGPYGKESWSAALRAKFGVVINPQVMLYVTAGYSAAGFDSSKGYWASSNGNTGPWTGSGAQFGVGASTQLSDHLLANVELTYANYGVHTLTENSDGAQWWDLMENNVSTKAGIAWKF